MHETVRSSRWSPSARTALAALLFAGLELARHPVEVVLELLELARPAARQLLVEQTAGHLARELHHAADGRDHRAREADAVRDGDAPSEQVSRARSRCGSWPRRSDRSFVRGHLGDAATTMLVRPGSASAARLAFAVAALGLDADDGALVELGGRGRAGVGEGRLCPVIMSIRIGPTFSRPSWI
jgi:hypothetical protein